MASIREWYNIANGTITHSHLSNNSYVDHGGYGPRDMQAVLDELAGLRAQQDDLAGLALGIEVLYNE